MKRHKAYYVQKPDGELVKENDCVVPYPTLEAARKVAHEVLGIIGWWDWINGKFVPRRRA